MAQNCFHFELLLLVVLLRCATWCVQLRLFFDTPLLNVHFYYRPQRSCGKLIFLHLCVILFKGGGGISVPACTTAHMTRGDGGLCLGGSLSRGCLSRESLSRESLSMGDLSLGAGVSLSREISVWGVAVHGGEGLCPWG